jgi:hypothetical protein
MMFFAKVSNAVCLRRINQDIELTDRLNDAVESSMVAAGADRSIHTGRAVRI